MTFNFDGGDILILILVAIAFILSRRFDKTGRSLEKVRRYAEKSKSELDAIVRERELGLKDLAVDLEVQEKTNREILARADAAREEILSRAEELETRVEKIEMHERALEDLNDLAIRVDENLVRLKEESAYVDQVGSRLSDVKEKFASIAEKDADRFASFRQEMLGNFKNELEAMSTGLEESGRQLSLYRETLEGLSARRDEEVNDKLSVFRDDLETIEEDFRERLRKVAEEGSRLEDDAFTALNEKIDSRSERLKDNWLGGMNELKDNVATTATEIQDMLNEAKTSMDIAGNEFRETEERLKDDAGEMEKTMQELREKLEHLVESKENELLESVEVRQNEYRRTVEDRFERIEGFIKDMDTVAESLRSSQAQTVREVDEAFTAFDVEMTERRELERTRIEEESAALRQDMSDLERGLDELKSRAYDNVSEKLQVFEDEFFTDLKNRDSQMRAALEEWNKNAELELAELGLKAGRDREATERRYSTELKQKLTDLQTRVFGQFESFQDQVDGFRESLNGRIKASEDELKAFRESLDTRISREKEAAAGEFAKAYDNFEKDVTEKFSKANKTIGQKLSDFARDIESRDKELTGEYQSSKDDLVEWKQRMAIQIDEALRDSGESIDTMKSDFAAKMSELQDEYSARTEQLVLESGEERAALRREIGVLEESVTRLTSELDEKSRDSLEALKEQSEAFLFEFRKNSRDAKEEMERKIKELRQSVQESREKAEANRKEMAAHTDAEYARLMHNLDEIDRRQREFITETRVFERADEMKAALEADIAELNRQLNEVGTGRDEIRSINTQYEKAVSLYEEVSGKLARFLSEQQKVDNLEGKIARIGSLSESVDLKLDRVTDANDTLQDLQVRLKQLEDLHEDLGARYQRLTEKSGILDAATEGVDKNFERLARIEDILKDLAERLLPLREELNSAEERQRRLEEDREKIDLVVGKVSTIDSTIAELDGKLDDLGKAREWLARTETRLEEISNEAQQKVRLLGTLTKRESGGRKSAGSPDMSTREVVVKLAREGWNSEEIARTTKLSRGEVELILELTPNE
jgi:DNA repair exonuclease SbcCD ATPase subunit